MIYAWRYSCSMPSIKRHVLEDALLNEALKPPKCLLIMSIKFYKFKRINRLIAIHVKPRLHINYFREV